MTKFPSTPTAATCSKYEGTVSLISVIKNPEETSLTCQPSIFGVNKKTALANNFPKSKSSTKKIRKLFARNQGLD
jgi:hypothetical protein